MSGFGHVVLVTGSRAYRDKYHVFDVLDAHHKLHDIGLLVSGGASGLDSFALDWAESREINALRVPAKWKKHKNAAGPIRNSEMLRVIEIDVVLSFMTDAGRGTHNMVEQANKAGLEVIEC